MRISAAISLLILAVAALFGWRDHHELAGLRSENYRLTGEAAVMGIALDEPAHGKHITKRERADKLEEARRTALDIIDLARELERLMESGDTTSVVMQDRILKALESIGSLDSEQLKVLIEAFRDAQGLSDNMHGVLLSVAFQALIDRNPKDALGLLLDEQSRSFDGSHRSHLVSASLSKWAESDPDDALRWVRDSSLDFMSRQAMETALVHGTARADLPLAMKWIGEFGISDKLGAITKIAGELDDLSGRAELLRLMKEQPEVFGQKEINGALVTMGTEIGRGGFDEGARWIKENGFSESEISNLIAGGLVSHAKGADRGRWLEWMGGNLTGEPRERYIGEQVRDWTAKDHRAAGEWLAALPEGPAKAPSVAAFATTVAEYDPQIATQWALTMPPGVKRKETLKEIHKHWPQDDAASKAAREAFAREHGLSE